MKIYTSYFYKIRFFKPNMIPISTAMWDPKWYHANQKQDHWFVDKNGVINGLRASVFAPGEVATAVSTCGPLCDKNFEKHMLINFLFWILMILCPALKEYVPRLKKFLALQKSQLQFLLYMKPQIIRALSGPQFKNIFALME